MDKKLKNSGHSFSARIRELRKARGWSQEELGKRVGVSLYTVSRWERNDHEPTLQFLPLIASALDVTVDFLLNYNMEYRPTQYSEKYEQEEFYWGEGVWDVAYDVLRFLPNVRPIRLLDVGCGEGQAAVFFARNGCVVSAFDIAQAGLKKGKKLAAENRVNVNFFQSNLASYEPETDFEVIYGHDVLEYLSGRARKRFMENMKRHTAVGGLNVFSTFVEKNFIRTAPDWEGNKEHYWQTGELFSYYLRDWKLERAEEVIIDCNSGGIPHQHCMDIIVARKMADD